MKLKCSVLCTKKESDLLDDLGLSEDAWLPCIINLDKAIAVKHNGPEGVAAGNAVVYFEGDSNNYFVIDMPYERVAEMYLNETFVEP